jgi:uncharacterized protein YjdB
MFNRTCLNVLLLAGLTLSIAGCTNHSGLDSISISPQTQSMTVGQSTQFTATATYGNGSHPTTQNITSGLSWVSSTPAVATVDASGVATAVGPGTTTITASAAGFDGPAVSTAAVTVTGAGGATAGGSIVAVTIYPSAQSLSESGQTGKFIALGTSSTSGLQVDVTNSPDIVWTSTVPSVATVSTGLPANDGVATGVSAGTSTITAEYTNASGGVVAGTAAVTVTTTAAPEPLLSLTIIPASITVGNLQDTGNFLAIGTFSTPPTVRDLTSTVAWISSEPNDFPVDTNSSGVNPGAPGGLVTAYGDGTGVIIAEATATDGTIQTATATFNCPLVLPDPPLVAGSCYPGSQAQSLLATVTVYNEGLNTTNWLITAPSATGTPNVIHCGPGAAAAGFSSSVCVATYPLNTSVTLKAPAGTGNFGGWSNNCTPQGAVTAAGPNSCQIVFPAQLSGTNENSNVTVGAIFN